ncbi:MAG: tRNA lysidine(34) synthetase TilS [Oligoflexia bacterium]|nr:tRNA lysidine(34) synthetase TilS [Oligoflexia bacterium]
MNKNFFIKHVYKFICKMNLFPTSTSSSARAFVAVSAGIDSLALLYTLREISREKNELRDLTILHVNHGTRGEENEREEKFLRELADEFNLKIEVLHLSFDKRNFEFRARELRYAFFKRMLNEKNGDVLYTAHHIDDSFEWSLMQNFKSSSAISSLGIPVRNGAVARPFMCVTKRQIYSWAKLMGIKYFEDGSNKDTTYDRNYIRQNIIPSIASRFPSYLKHYVYRSNDLAAKFNLHRNIHMDVHLEKKNQELFIMKDIFAGIIFYNNSNSRSFDSYHSLQSEMIRVICKLSNRKRGVLRSQITKVINAACSGDRWGPITFSGGVCAFIFSKMILFASEDILEKYKDYDFKISSEIPELEKNFPYLNFPLGQESEIVHYYQKNHRQHPFPYWIISNEKSELDKIYRGIMREHPLFPQTTRYFLEKNIWFRPLHDVHNFVIKNKIKGNKLKEFKFCII